MPQVTPRPGWRTARRNRTGWQRSQAVQTACVIVGPNCFGIANNVTRAAALFIPRHDQLPHLLGPIGIVSQSGALGYTMVQASERGVGYSHYLAAGNSCDVDVCDFASYLVDDPACRAIALCFEGRQVGRAACLRLGAKAIAADKPIIVYKVANGAASAQAALSHTGTLAGSDADLPRRLRARSLHRRRGSRGIIRDRAVLCQGGPAEGLRGRRHGDIGRCGGHHRRYWRRFSKCRCRSPARRRSAC